MLRIALCWLWLVGLCAAAPAEFRGMPFIKRFAPSDYRGSPWNSDVLASRDGHVYLANRRGLIRFDGSRWTLMHMPGTSGVYALAEGADGGLYVGGDATFGRVELDTAGNMRYRALEGEFPSKADGEQIGWVSTVLATPAGVYFRTVDELLFYGRDGQRSRHPVADTVRRAFAANGELLARVDQSGLSRWDGTQMVLLEGGERFATVGIAEIVGAPEGPLVISDAGLFRVAGEKVIAVEGADQAAFTRYVPNVAITVADGGLLVGTEAGELAHFDRDFRLVNVFPVSRHAIDHLVRDREGGTWMAGQGLLGRAEIPSRWATYPEAYGLQGEVYDTAYRDGRLWVGTSEGLFEGSIQNQRTRFDKRRDRAAYSLLADREGLLLVDDDGVLLLDPASGRERRLVDGGLAIAIERSRFDPDRILALDFDHILLIERGPQGLYERARWPLDGVDASTVYEETADRLWIGDQRGGPILWRWDPASAQIVERRRFDAGDGFELDPAYGSAVFGLDDHLYAVSGGNVFGYGADRFQPVKLAPFSQVEDPGALTLVETGKGDFAFNDRQLFRRIPGSNEWQSLAVGDPLAQGFSQVRVGEDGKLRVVSWAGLLQFDPDVPEPELPLLHVQLQRAQREQADGSSVSVIDDAISGIELPADAVLRLAFGMGSLEAPSEIRYRVRGLINSWSPWIPGEAQLTLSYPGSGSFALEVQGRTQAGRKAVPLMVPISAPPRWWQTPGALVLGALLASLLTLMLSLRFQRYRDERDQALQAANLDPLTGVFNRRAGQARLRVLAGKARTRTVPFAALFVDIDHFKSINDRFGHAAGDQCLRVVAERVRRELRGGDVLVRWGGEEFVCLLDGAVEADAQRIAERIRARIAASDVVTEGRSIAVTVSIGIGVFEGREDSAEHVLDRADAALYAAKHAGRDRVMPPMGETAPNGD